jgi:DNA-directed RNA polymerase specialized sigma24 family protein
MDRSAIMGADSRLLATAGSDAELIAALVDELARIRRLARVLVGDAEVADDLVGEAIARTLRRWRERRVSDCGAYVRRTVVNLASRRCGRTTLESAVHAAPAVWSGWVVHPIAW